jgi:hypothetical protein
MLKSQQNQLSYPFLLFKWLCAAAAIESLLAFFVMLVIPADPKNTWLFGYSKTRILIIGLFLVAVLVAGFGDCKKDGNAPLLFFTLFNVLFQNLHRLRYWAYQLFWLVY